MGGAPFRRTRPVAVVAMCGLAGWAGLGPAHHDLEPVLRALGHRGPDGTGTDGATGAGWGWELAHTRLAIVDTSDAGAQPIANEDGSLVLVFNGEIYNTAELRRWCEVRGHRFRSHMDGEVVLHLFEEQGEAAFARLNGIFALALASKRTGEVVLARDPLGVKPLLHSSDGDGLWFASELPALHALEAPVGSPDLVALAQFLTFLWVPSPRTPLTGVRALPPGATLRWSPAAPAGSKLTLGSHTDLVAEAIAAETFAAPPSIREVGEQVTEAVRRQLLSDVPLGLMASGGVDSTLLWQSAGDDLSRAFSVSWDPGDRAEGLSDDLDTVRSLAARWGTPLTEVPAPSQASDAPPPSGDLFADPAYELTRNLSRAAGVAGVKVLMSGQGGDEVFGGYRRHVMAPWIGRLPTLPLAALDHVVGPMARRGGVRAEYGARTLSALTRADRMDRYLTLCSYSGAADRAAVLGCTEHEVSDEVVWADHRAVYDRLPADWSLLRVGRLLDLTVYLPGLGLAYADRAGMAEGIEVRVPFLDLDLVRWALRLPDRALVRRGQGKILTKQLLADRVSSQVAYRPKRGFGVPTRALKTDDAPWSRGFRQASYFSHATRVLARAAEQWSGVPTVPAPEPSGHEGTGAIGEILFSPGEPPGAPPTGELRSVAHAPRSPRTKGNGGGRGPERRAPRVVIDAASARLGGGLSYITRQLTALEQVRPDLQLAVIAAPWNAAALRQVLTSPVSVPRLSNAAVRYGWEQIVLPWQLGAGDVLYCPGNFAPLLPHRAATVVTLQNPNYVGPGPLLPSNRTAAERAKANLSLRSMQAADRVVVISHALAADLAGDLPEVVAKTVVIHSGAPTWSSDERRPGGIPEGSTHLLSLANDAAHKNLDHVIDAWVRAFADAPAGSVPLLVVAGDVSMARRIEQRARVPDDRRDKLVHLGAISDPSVLRWLLNHAVAMMAASSLEAFPLTPAEAGSLGCPLVLSDIPAHREVAGDHATYVPVGDIDGFARAVWLATVAPPPRRPWTWPVTWEQNAARLADVFDEVVAEPLRRPANDSSAGGSAAASFDGRSAGEPLSELRR